MGYSVKEDIALLTGKIYGNADEIAVLDILSKDKTSLAELHHYVTDVKVLAAIVRYLKGVKKACQ